MYPSTHSLIYSSIISLLYILVHHLSHHHVHHLTPSPPYPSCHSLTSSIISLLHILILHLTPSPPHLSFRSLPHLNRLSLQPLAFDLHHLITPSPPCPSSNSITWFIISLPHLIHHLHVTPSPHPSSHFLSTNTTGTSVFKISHIRCEVKT